MPLAKTYLRYSQESRLGVIAGDSEIVYVGEGDVAVNGLENLSVWNVRTNTEIESFVDDAESVAHGTALAMSPQKAQLASGSSDGAVRLWKLQSTDPCVVLSGHRGSVTHVSYDKDGNRLVSGSNDTDIIVWDVVNECGIVRLRGHKGPISACLFHPTLPYVISASRDTFVKIWDLDTQHCVDTIVGHRAEVCSLALDDGATRLVTGSTDEQLRIYQVEETDNHELKVTYWNSLKRESKSRMRQLDYSPDGNLLCCQAADKTIEVFRVNSEEDVKKRMARRGKRLKKKRKNAAEESGEPEEAVEEPVRQPDDELTRLCILRTSAKIRSFAIRVAKGGAFQYELAASLASNAIETYKLVCKKKTAEWTKAGSVAHSGHRTPIRAVALSSDNSLVLSTSQNGAKVWNRVTGECVRSLDSGYGLCCAFVAGDRHVLIGTKEGAIQLFALSSGNCIEEFAAHEKAVRSITMLPDDRGFITGSADHMVKFFEFELIPDEEKGKGTRLSCAHVRTLKMADDVMATVMGRDQRLLAVALLDATVKVFFADTLKFFLSLYGHKLPVVSMAISADGTLLATGSSDKNIKLWGLDFGDCHKSFFAHQDTITSIQFVGTTHHFFSTSKDHEIKYWDGDNFQHVTTLKAHHGEIWGSAISPNGKYFVTGSHDRSIRVWCRSTELLSLEEEREKERDEQFEQEQEEQEARTSRATETEEAGLPSRRTADTLTSAEKVVEALELVDRELQREPGTPVNPILIAYGNITPQQYLLQVLDSIRSSDLEEALLVLPFPSVSQLLVHLNGFLERNISVERTMRILLFLVRTHHNQIVATRELRDTLNSLRKTAPTTTKKLKDTIGFNLAAMKFAERELEEAGIRVFEDLEQQVEQKQQKKKVIVST